MVHCIFCVNTSFNPQKMLRLRVDGIPCGNKFLRVLIFQFFSRSAKKVPAKKISSKNFLHNRNYIQTLPFTCKVKSCWCPFTSNVSFVQKQNEIRTKHSEIKRWNCSWQGAPELAHYKYMYLTVKSFKEKDRLKVLHWLTACFLPVFDCLYSKNDNVIIPDGRRLPENCKN